MDGNIEKYAALIDNPGRAHIQKVLRTHSNPAQALVELQQTLGFKYSANIGMRKWSSYPHVLIFC
jgi:hypothetical protein